MVRYLGIVTIVLAAAGCATQPAGGRFDVGFIGDQQYDARSTAQYPALLASLDRADLAFAVHVGDFGSPRYGACRDETYLARRDEFNALRHPLIYTPGDNEWTDCHQAGDPDSLGRLAKLRDVFFADDRSIGGRRIPLARQSADPRRAKFRENARWTLGGVVFATLHMPGSNNNLARTPEMDAEHAERNAANLDWLAQTFRRAKADGARGIMLITQANPYFEHAWPPRRRAAMAVAAPPKRPDGYADFVAALTREVLASDRPVALVHGDTHYFRIDQPLVVDDAQARGFGRQVEHFTRVEGFGFPASHWVRATVDPDDPAVFRFRAEIVRENAGAAPPK